MSQIFISYKRKDKDKVFVIKDLVEKQTGSSCWIDLEGIESDAQFVHVIIRAINEASIVLFTYSQYHAKIQEPENDWTIRELLYAQQQHKRIVFVNLDATPLTQWFSFMFNAQQQIDATKPEDLRKMILDIRGWLEKSPKSSSAQYAYTTGLEYVFYDSSMTAAVKGAGTSKLVHLQIPPSIQRNGKTYTITRILERAFFDSKTLQSVVIPPTVKQIDSAAFRCCSQLQTVSLPDSVTNVGWSAFGACAKLKKPIYNAHVFAYMPPELTGVYTIPNGISMIASCAFEQVYDSLLYYVSIPKNNLGVSSVTIPNSVKIIDKNAFKGVLNINHNLKIEGAPWGAMFENKYVLDGLAFDDEKHTQLVGCSRGINGVLKLPASVKHIKKGAFNNCYGITSVVLAEGVESIEDGAFCSCSNLETINIPHSMKCVAPDAFFYCNKLTNKPGYFSYKIRSLFQK